MRKVHCREICYALVARDEGGECLGVVGTGRELETKHRMVAPAMRHLCSSLFRTLPGVASVDIVAWSPGLDVRNAVPVFSAYPMERAGWIYYTRNEDGPVDDE